MKKGEDLIVGGHPSSTDKIITHTTLPYNMNNIEGYMDDNTETHWRKYPLDDFVQALESENGEMTTPEIRAEVGCSPETARRRMKELDDKGVVEGRKIGSTLVWKLA
ncbi:Lrp/AsnC family transcriptional regulator [Halococcus sp. PRR34]|uniref:Lrp/AsnC family transcriptional regulator n=1 Tax=Halococcus sp. PRR34 TaxID=3020830 RepID=UPI002361E547|nr:Lrp/AsnC family transcriptional regulator [Halococcus sp. PRR34]